MRLVPLERQARELRVQRIGDLRAHLQSDAALEDAPRSVERPRTEIDGEHERDVPARAGEISEAGDLDRIDRLRGEPRDEQLQRTCRNEQTDGHDVDATHAASVLPYPPIQLPDAARRRRRLR